MPLTRMPVTSAAWYSELNRFTELLVLPAVVEIPTAEWLWCVKTADRATSDIPSETTSDTSPIERSPSSSSSRSSSTASARWSGCVYGAVIASVDSLVPVGTIIHTSTHPTPFASTEPATFVVHPPVNDRTSGIGFAVPESPWVGGRAAVSRRPGMMSELRLCVIVVEVVRDEWPRARRVEEEIWTAAPGGVDESGTCRNWLHKKAGVQLEFRKLGLGYCHSIRTTEQKIKTSKNHY